MRDHARLLGTFFVVWGILQLVLGLVFVAPWGAAPAQNAWFSLVLAAIACAIYVWIGTRLRLHDPSMRVPSIGLSVLALLSFPLGTVLGIYGLWATLGAPKLLQPRNP